ncbi:acyl-CoA dehydratase activase-related protein [Limnochorda pilosa]|uniref:DUF2229 domain-containing protein n=1 Tax=Limnochorda pilosa TaxID=1555112 RepID=A0A0K2SH09_LIMPI|nr:acyl-CoA dehydratase activase-related protein [Limnochorda pilosa]BAS26114.1 hypothetical protein LIP_0257 [Limnochorda pilosa]
MSAHQGEMPGSLAPKVGIVHAFSGHYRSVHVISRFLHHAGVRLVQSRVTTPEILAAGTTFASQDFCIPLRAYVGHVYHLVKEHRDLECIVAPNVLSEDASSSTCSKYRDVGGVSIRSLGTTVGYTLKFAAPRWRERMSRLAGRAEVERLLGQASNLPRIIQPNVRLLEPVHMRNVCFDTYADIFRLPRWVRGEFFIPGALRRWLAPRLSRVEQAFDRAWAEVMAPRHARLNALLRDESRVRLAIVGRSYLVHDPALTCDLRTFFQKAGAAVLTAEDVPFELLRERYLRVKGFYDTHRLGEAFIDWATTVVDGFVIVGSFGCHPDAFMVDYLADVVRERGLPCWTFKYDEQAGSAGFRTRYETILGFLQERRDQRVARRPQIGATSAEPTGTFNDAGTEG